MSQGYIKGISTNTDDRYEYRVIVKRLGGAFWYTLQRRRWFTWLPFALWWSNVCPMYQPSYEAAMQLRNKKGGGDGR